MWYLPLKMSNQCWFWYELFNATVFTCTVSSQSVGSSSRDEWFFHRFAMASHFLWGLWSIIQARISKIEFGYMVSTLVDFTSPGEIDFTSLEWKDPVELQRTGTLIVIHVTLQVFSGHASLSLLFICRAICSMTWLNSASKTRSLEVYTCSFDLCRFRTMPSHDLMPTSSRKSYFPKSLKEQIDFNGMYCHFYICWFFLYATVLMQKRS